jgi:hypothetical protein
MNIGQTDKICDNETGNGCYPIIIWACGVHIAHATKTTTIDVKILVDECGDILEHRSSDS